MGIVSEHWHWGRSHHLTSWAASGRHLPFLSPRSFGQSKETRLCSGIIMGLSRWQVTGPATNKYLLPSTNGLFSLTRRCLGKAHKLNIRIKTACSDGLRGWISLRLRVLLKFNEVQRIRPTLLTDERVMSRLQRCPLGGWRHHCRAKT